MRDFRDLGMSMVVASHEMRRIDKLLSELEVNVAR